MWRVRQLFLNENISERACSYYGWLFCGQQLIFVPWDSKLFHRPLIVGANRPLQTNFSIRPFRTYVRPPVNLNSLKEGLISCLCAAGLCFCECVCVSSVCVLSYAWWNFAPAATTQSRALSISFPSALTRHDQTHTQSQNGGSRVRSLSLSRLLDKKESSRGVQLIISSTQSYNIRSQANSSSMP